MIPEGGVRLEPSEIRRKAVHLGCGFLALSLRWLTWEQALVVALAAVAFNAIALPLLGGRGLLRDPERARGFAPGVLLYPVAVALVIAAFGPFRGLTVPAMAWALLAFGDGAAGLAGLSFGRRRLPWNPRKSVEGLVAHVALGAAGATAVGAFVSRADQGLGPGALVILMAAIAAALVTAFMETLDGGVDDNLVVPILGAIAVDLAITLGVSGAGPFAPASLAMAGACAGLGLVVWWRGLLTAGGAATAAVMGSLVGGWAGLGALATLGAFFVLGVAVTRLGRRVKEQRGIAEARGGRRGFGNVVANGGMALACALLAAHGGFGFASQGPPPHEGLATGSLVALVAALATASFDTVSSEVGKAHGRVTVLITSWRRVPPGTEGAISLEGTLAGLAASALVGLLGIGWLLGAEAIVLVPVVVVPAALAGTTFESVVGAVFERRGHRIQNDLLNFANTLVGAATAGALMLLLA